MQYKQSILQLALLSALVGSGSASEAGELPKENAQLFEVTTSVSSKQTTGLHIVQLKGSSGIAHALEIGELTPSNQLARFSGNRYNPQTPAMAAYTNAMKQRQAALVREIGDVDILNSYAHTFNGFSARLSSKQVQALKQHPDVMGVYVDEVHMLQTSNTPEFLGLTGPGGQHTLDIKGEDIIVGILDTGIWPENPSFADDGSYSDPVTELGWQGTCDAGDEAASGTFQCNNKLIGARYFSNSFEGRFDLRFDLGEMNSPRDVDSHGSHVASTAAGNEGVEAIISNTFIGTVSGVAPRARVAAYKVCWNSGYVSPEGVDEHGCFFGDSMAAIDQAVVDGVDVLNYSIGNSLSINSPVYNAALLAAQAGVFFSASAGNSGRDGQATVSNIAPWITTVGASTYDGISANIGDALDLSVNEEAQAPLFSIEGEITAPIPDGGLSGKLVIAEPVLACDPMTNPDALNGNIALIARGTCAFSTKIINAQEAGATAVVVYSDARAITAMGGDATGVSIPGSMIKNSDGLELASILEGGASIQVAFTDRGLVEEVVEVGNLMADFSSKGVNRQSADILKPDITAPGVRILAATSEDQMNIPGNTDGENFTYLQGTSMSSPHIAGMAALLMGEHPSWSPAQVKSALMTTAHQNVLKDDGLTAADPFDFGGGHAAPVLASNPGLTYDANIGDYLGFLCGQNEATLVSSLAGESCQDLSVQGFAQDASQLNYPSIAIGELEISESVTRTVTDVTGVGGEYNIVIDAPDEVRISIKTFDSRGVETEGDTIVVEPNGTASYELSFSKEPGFTPDVWRFGSITLESATHTVRSPIAVRPVLDPLISAPETVSMELRRGRGSFSARMGYSGSTSINYAGLTPGSIVEGVAPNKNGAGFDFDTAVADDTFHLFSIPDNTQVARFSLGDALVTSAASGEPVSADLDLFVYRCLSFSCSFIEASESNTSNEDVILVNPEPRTGLNGDFYIVFVHAQSAGAEEAVNYTSPFWIANDPVDRSTRISSSPRAIEGRFNNVRISTRGLQEGVIHMGAVTFLDENGDAQATTVLEILP